MKGSEVLEENLKKAHITENDLKARLRKANITSREDILAVVFETSGEISVLHSRKETEADSWLLEGIN